VIGLRSTPLPKYVCGQDPQTIQSDPAHFVRLVFRSFSPKPGATWDDFLLQPDTVLLHKAGSLERPIRACWAQDID